jgi:hypothetical protein
MFLVICNLASYTYPESPVIVTTVSDLDCASEPLVVYRGTNINLPRYIPALTASGKNTYIHVRCVMSLFTGCLTARNGGEHPDMISVLLAATSTSEPCQQLTHNPACMTHDGSTAKRTVLIRLSVRMLYPALGDLPD